ncbi:MAG TPA: ester cyclase [Candidatus Dormibacteraeota bacterium]|nr:ester cyclase [Candidatus Dormibacteraeota bacterium]
MAEDLKDLTRKYIHDVWNQGRLEMVAQLVAPGCITHDPGAPGGELRGPDGVRQLVSMYRNAFPDTQLEIKDLIVEGDKVAARITASGTHKGELMGIEPTGKRVSISGNLITWFRDGKQVESWSSYDQLGMLQQLGVVPSIQAAPRT